MAVKEWIPKNEGIVKAALWSGKADCLMDMPRLNEVIVGIRSIDDRGYAEVEYEGKDYVMQPRLHYLVIDAYGKLQVWTVAFMREHYKEVPAVAEAPTQKGSTYSIAGKVT